MNWQECGNCGKTIRMMTRVEALNSGNPRRFIHVETGARECDDRFPDCYAIPALEEAPRQFTEVNCLGCGIGIPIGLAAMSNGRCPECAPRTQLRPMLVTKLQLGD